MFFLSNAQTLGDGGGTIKEGASDRERERQREPLCGSNQNLATQILDSYKTAYSLYWVVIGLWEPVVLKTPLYKERLLGWFNSAASAFVKHFHFVCVIFLCPLTQSIVPAAFKLMVCKLKDHSSL